MQHDALVHLLAMRWFTELWRPSFDRASTLFGAYPGVEFFEQGEPDSIGEADVLLIQSDGELIPGECKRRGVGLKDADVEKLEHLANRLDSPWSFMATLDQASACPAIWTESRRELPEKPRFGLTAEHLFEPMVFWPAGANILAWRPETTAAASRGGTRRNGVLLEFAQCRSAEAARSCRKLTVGGSEYVRGEAALPSGQPGRIIENALCEPGYTSR
jgi:hypothetical protein